MEQRKTNLRSQLVQRRQRDAIRWRAIPIGDSGQEWAFQKMNQK
jgi:hypothetical protein